MNPLIFVDLGEFDPREEASFVRFVTEAVGKDKTGIPAILAVSFPQSRTYSLGRYQIPDVAVHVRACEESGAALIRRLTGGKTVFQGEGMMVVSLVLPSPSAFSDPIPFGKVINRYVRGILTGLNSIGLHAMYYGGDFIAVNRKKAGYLTMEIDANGVVLFQAVVAWDREYPLPEELSRYPRVQKGRRPEPEPTTLVQEVKGGLSRETLVEAIVNGYQKRFGVEFEKNEDWVDRWKSFETATGSKPDTADTLRVDGEKVWTPSKIIEFPLGYFQAWVKGPRNQPAQVKLTGDLIAGSAGIALLEGALGKTPPKWENLGRTVDEFFKDPDHYILGVKDLKMIPDAVMDALQSGDRGRDFQ